MSPEGGRSLRYWLLKSEPELYSFEDLWREPGRTTGWDGVRNYQARNFMQKEMRSGDGVLFYHSSRDQTGIAGLAEVAREAYPDPTQFEPGHPHYDRASRPEEPRWYQVDVRAARRVPRVLPLEELRQNPRLKGLELLRRGSRLSVLPVSATHWREILGMLGLRR